MRSLSTTMKKKLASRIQAGDNAISSSLWVARPTTPLTEDRYLEKQTVLSSSSITKTSIAVCHPRLMRGATEVYIGYLESGIIKVARTTYVEEMDRHVWDTDIGYSQAADDFCLCFDGTMPKAPNGYVEFKTEQLPWVFWVLDNVLYGRKMGDTDEPFVLAEANCSAVSAVRAMWSTSGGFDFGLVVFFLLNGQLYYRQLIDGEWMDAEVVSFGPDGVKWEALAAFRTWDYRIGVQLKSVDGAFYEMFTQFMGVGKQLTEHIGVNVKPKSNYVTIEYSDSALAEHIEAKVSPQGNRIYGLSSVPVSVNNIDDGSGNYGILVQVILDYPVTKVEGNATGFSMVDSNGASYTCTGCAASKDGLILTLEFMDFNLAEGASLTLSYTPGTILSPATPMDAFSVTFTPEGLVAPDIPVPEPVEAWNVDAEGTEVALRFSQALVGDTTGLETPVGYTQKSIDLSGATITTLNTYSSGTTGAKAIDGNLSTYWRGTTAVNWIQFQLLEAKVITHIRMYLGSYYIKTFTVSGSNDGSTWTQLGGEYTAASSTTAQWYSIQIDNKESYLYYKIDTLTAYSSRIYLYEVELQETVPIGNESRFSIEGETYEYVPNGELEPANRIVTAVSTDPDDTTIVYLKLNPGNVCSVRNLVGDVRLFYAGGTLRGLGGPVADFTFKFTPSGLEPKYHPNSDEHIEATVDVNSKLTRVYYTDTSESEHIETAVTPVGTLISVDDI